MIEITLVYAIRFSAFFDFYFSLNAIMIETTLKLVYAIGLGAFFAVLILRRPVHRFVELVCPLLLQLAHYRPVSSIVKRASKLVARRLCYPTVLRRGKYTDR